MKDYIIEIKDDAKGEIIKKLLQELGFVEIRKDVFVNRKQNEKATD